jgi:hypothetical protein
MRIWLFPKFHWRVVISCLVLVSAVSTSSFAQATTSTPTVSKAIVVSEKSHPFTVGGTNLAEHGYRLDEYFISGNANVYNWGDDGKATTPQVRTADAPYTTRIIVRRPEDTSQFSGNVWVELNNPSRGWDVEVEWPTVQEKVLRDGDIWVAVTVKPNVIASLKRIDSTRYAPLAMANPLPADKQLCGLLPGQDGYDENLSKLYENGLVWDILSQTGALVRSKDSSNPLHNYDVKYVFATGESQTGFFLNTYAANFAENAKLANGHAVYDGFVSVSGAGQTTPINQCVAATEVNDIRSQLPNKHVPFMRIDAQGDIFQLESYLSRRPDSDVPGAGYRMYEIAGAPHGPAYIVNYQPPADEIKKSGDLPTSVAYAYGGVEAKANQVPRQYIEPAMFANMERWVIQGILPPRSEPLQVQAGVGSQKSLFGTTINASFVKDKYGNVLGGVRSPQLEVPTATYYEWATLKPGYAYAWSFGHQDDFNSETLQKLYGAVSPHQNYLAKVKSSVKKLVRERWLEPQEGMKIIQQAEFTPIP